MSSPADLPTTTAPPRPVARCAHAVVLALAVLATSVVVTVTAASPAHALHQHCGDDLTGTYSESNGHPDLDASNPGWSGQERLQELAVHLRRIETARTVIGDVVASLDATADLLEATREVPIEAVLAVGTPASQIYLKTGHKPLSIAEKAVRIAAKISLVADFVTLIIQTAVMSAEFVMQVDVDDEDACGGTLTGDTLTMTWVAMVQRNLASSGPPLAMLMAPHDPAVASTQPEWPILPRMEEGDFPWCPDIPADLLTGALPAPGVTLPTTDGDCTSTVQLGFLDAPSLGVKDIVTNTIGHLVAHGVDVRGAEDLLTQGDAALEAGRYSDAFHLYRAAYQTAMAVTTR